jgi:flagellar biosynthesis protein FlhF
MNFQRFLAPTAREALAQARLTFGDGTVIFSNKQTAHGVEVIAAGEESLAQLEQAAISVPTAHVSLAASAQSSSMPTGKPPAAPSFARAAAQAAAAQRMAEKAPVEDDADQLAMSTLSFQDYVRERTLQRRHEEEQKTRAETAARSRYTVIPAPEQAAPAPIRKTQYAPSAPVHAAPTAAAPAMPGSNQITAGLVNELQAMKDLIEDRFSTLAWLGQARKNPIRANLTLKLIRAGYSPSLARSVLERMPDEANPAEAIRWMLETLERGLRTDAGDRALHDEGGVFALVGATGVGKTTTVAKIAAQCARTYGAGSVGMITLDNYRVGAHEQLRAYGRMLGVVAHTAHDRAALQDLLTLLSNRKMVLIDTTGVAPRDPRKREMLDMLALPQIKRLLVLNAASHGDTQDEAVASFRDGNAVQTVITKVDEAVKLGPTLDAAIRHQLMLRGVCGGQRVPEDWERANASMLVRTSMRSAGKSPFDPQLDDLGLYFAQPSSSGMGAGAFHA